MLGFTTILIFSTAMLLPAADRFVTLPNPGDPGSLVWDSRSADARGSMPIGNGDIGLNVWVEPSGELLLFIGKTDAWDENMRLLKVGKVRLRITPHLDSGPFTQTLDLAHGRVLVQGGGVEISVWVDANHPVIQVDAKSMSGEPLSAVAGFEIWRVAQRPLTGRESHSIGFASGPAISYPDTVLAAESNCIGWYHRNVDSPWRASLKLQKLDAIADQQADPILNRTTGAILRGDPFVPVSAAEMKSVRPSKELSLRVHVLTQITETPERWRAAVEQQAAAIEEIPASERWQAHSRWWREFWDRSWIQVTAGPESGLVTCGYTLQRWANACAGRGAFPIKFNGSIFVVDKSDSHGFDADFRLWGGGYWFQNTRLIYWSMLDAGDYDLMQPLFDMYLKALPARKLATRTYYGHEGAFFPETMSFWGNYLDNHYGTDRTGKPDGLTDNQYIRRYWQGGIELLALMLDYYAHTQDSRFRDHALLPLADEIIAFFDHHWPRGLDGKISLRPAQSLETWWDCTNPTPEVAGLRWVLPQLITLAPNAARKQSWKKTLADLPPLPLGRDEETEERYILPAEHFANKHNAENPELFAVFPYRLGTVATGGEVLEYARNSWTRRGHRENRGWQQNSVQAALLGRAKEACGYVVDSAAASAAGFRFPAFWGPNYDWVPDQDHGTVMMSALQRMLVQYDGRKIVLLPAWPKDWSVQFKLHAPFQTTVQGRVAAGKITELNVDPPSRMADIFLSTGQ
jgi:hypothetical protein